MVRYRYIHSLAQQSRPSTHIMTKCSTQEFVMICSDHQELALSGTGIEHWQSTAQEKNEEQALDSVFLVLPKFKELAKLSGKCWPQEGTLCIPVKKSNRVAFPRGKRCLHNCWWSGTPYWKLFINEEADTRVIVHLFHTLQTSSFGMAQARDTDVVVILLPFSSHHNCE